MLFVSAATARPGWNEENAREWAATTADDALEACRGSADHIAEIAAQDVKQAEWESANAY